MNDIVWETVDEARDWLDRANGRNDDELTFRILKITEEAGEAAAAWIGVRGTNPRKGVTHSRDDVAVELADVVVTALVAIASLGFDPRQVVDDRARLLGERFTEIADVAETAETAETAGR